MHDFYFNKSIRVLSKLKSNKLFKDSFWTIYGNFIFKGLALLSAIFIAKFLGKEMYGEFGIIKNTVLSIVIFSTFGLGYSSNKFIAQSKENGKQKIRLVFHYSVLITFFITSILFVLLVTNASYISREILKAPELINYIYILGFMIIISSFVYIFTGVLSGMGKFKEMAKVNALLGIIMFFLSVIFTYFFKLKGAVYSLLITHVLNFIFLFLLLKKNIPDLSKGFKLEVVFLKEILSFSLPIALQEAVFSLTYWLSSFLIIRYSSYGDLGLYTVVLQWNSIILFIPGMLRNVVLSHLSEAEGKKEEHFNIMKKVIAVNFIVTIIPLILIFFFSGFISDMYGSSFEGLGSLLKFSVFITLFTSLSNVFSQVYISLGLNWKMFIFKLFRDVGLIFGFFVFIKYFDSGAKSIIFSSIIFNFAFLLLVLMYYKKRRLERENIL